METSPKQSHGNDQQENAAGQPDSHCQLPAALPELSALIEGTKDLALLSGGICRLAGDAEDVCGLRTKVAQTGRSLAHGNPVLAQKTLACITHQKAVPVRVIHDAVERVHAAWRRRPADDGRGGGDVLNGDSHVEFVF